MVLLGDGVEYRFSNERMYALSARGTGSPSLMKERKRDFRNRKSDGFCSGRREIGGVPKVMQWIRLKPVDGL